MARRRMISQDLIIDEHINSLSLGAQNIFVRLLAVSDDYGVVPSNEYTLSKLVNPPKKVNLMACLLEIAGAGLGILFEYGGNGFFMFKRDRFDDYQSYVIAKRTKSEYLRLSKEEMESKKFQEFLGSYSRNSKTVSTSIESREYKVESRKQKEGDEKKKFGDAQLVELTGDEYVRLVKRLGSDARAFAAIEILGNYLGQSEKNLKRYDSHYRAILNWVIGELETREKKAQPAGKYVLPSGPRPQPTRKLSEQIIGCSMCGKDHKASEPCQ